MRRTLLLLGLVAAALVLSGTPAAAQPTVNLTVTAAVAARASLTLSSAALTFVDADPDTVPSITGNPAITVTARSRTTGGNAVSLTVVALTDLTSGLDTIPAANISWAATGALTAGTLGLAPVTIGNWSGSGFRTGDMTFALINSWAYAIGNYTATVVYTLSAP